MEENNENEETPKVFRVAQLPVSGGGGLDRRTFIKGTVAVVGAGAMMTVLGGCGGGDEDDDPNGCVCNTVCPCENVGACKCDLVQCECQLGCACDTVCPCETVGTCTCNKVVTTCNELPGTTGTVKPGTRGINVSTPTGETRTMPCGSPIPAGWVCTCNCVTVPAASKPKPKPAPKPNPAPCSCDGQGGGFYISYWHPN